MVLVPRFVALCLVVHFGDKFSAVKGIDRGRIPSASWIALAIAATVGPSEHSPTP